MATARCTSYQDYNITEQEKRFLLAYCRCKNANMDLIRECAEHAHPGIAEELFHHVTSGRSYDRMMYVPIGKVDFYGYRRRMLAELKTKLIESGDLISIGGNVWTWYF